MKEYSLAINGHQYTVLIKEVTDTAIIAEVNGKEHSVSIEAIANISPFLEAEEIASASLPSPTPTRTETISKGAQNVSPDAAGGVINTPIPGQIIGLSVSVGDKVKKGQKLLTLEAMKLENAITADRDGTVKEIYVALGEVVSQGQQLVAIG